MQILEATEVLKKLRTRVGTDDLNTTIRMTEENEAIDTALKYIFDTIDLLTAQDELENDAQIAMHLNFELNQKLRDQTKIVRCMDCKHYLLPENESRGECMARAGWFPVDTDWFCADGERKDDNA